MALQRSNTAVTVGTSSTEVVPATNRENRRQLVITNDSDSTIYFAIDDTAVINQGIRLAVAEKWWIEDGDGLNVAINAIAGAASKNVTVYEEYEDAL